MGRQYYGIAKSFNGDTYQVELHNSAAASDFLLTIKAPKIDWNKEGEYLYDAPIMSSQATVTFVMRDENDHGNFKDIHLDPETEWSMRILKNNNLHWVGRVLADQMRFPREAIETGHALIEITAVDGLDLLDGFLMSAINFSIGDRQTVASTIVQIINLVGLSGFWGAAEVYLQDGIKTVNATSSGGTMDGSIRNLAFIKNYDSFKDLNDVQWMSCREGLAAIMTAFGAQIIHSEGKYIVRQGPAYDDDAYDVLYYNKSGGSATGVTSYTHRHLVQTTKLRPQWLSYPIKSFQRPVRECEVQFDQENGAFDYKATYNTTAVSAELTGATAGNNSGSTISFLGRSVKVNFSYKLAYSNSSILRYNLRYRIFAENPSTGDVYVFANDVWYLVVAPVNYSTLRIPTPPLYRAISSTYQATHEFEVPEPPTGATEVHADFYIERETAKVVWTGKPPSGTMIVWTTPPTVTNHSFIGSVLIRQSYTNTDPMTYRNAKNFISDLDAPRDDNSKRLIIKSEFYNGTSYDVGSYLAWNGSNYVEPGDWSAPWTATTGDLPELLADQWTGLYSDFRDKIDGTLFDNGDYEAGYSLFFDDIIWIFNGGTHNLDDDTWEGQWIGILTEYTNVNNQGEGEYVLTEDDIIGEKLKEFESEFSRIRDAVGDAGKRVIEDIFNDGIDAPSTDPGMDKEWGLNMFYDSTEPAINFKLVDGKTIIKSIDETATSDASLSNDSELLFYMEANKMYFIDIMVFFTTGAGNFKYALTGPTAPTHVFVQRSHGDVTPTYGMDTGYTASTAITGISPGFVQMSLTVDNVNAGVFAFQWAQNTSDGTQTKVHGGSKLTYQGI